MMMVIMMTMTAMIKMRITIIVMVTLIEHIVINFRLIRKQLMLLQFDFFLSNPLVFSLGHYRPGRIERCTGCSGIKGKRVPLLMRQG